MFDFAMAAVACIILAHFAPTESQVARAMPPEDMPDLAGARPVETIEASGNATSNMTAADQAKILKMSSGDIAHEQLWDQLSEEDMCTRWRGVFCTEDGLLRGILVEDETGMSGQRLPPEWGNLTTLRFIILVENDLTGPLPAEWSKLTNLIMLDLADNRLTGSLPEAWSTFSDLRFLSLEGNELNGSLPESWSAMTSIKDLQLDDNMLLGSLPAEWGDGMKELRELDLDNNRIYGNIPAGWSGLDSLEAIDLYNNRLSGSIPQVLKDNLDDTIISVRVDDTVTGVSDEYMPFAGVQWDGK